MVGLGTYGLASKVPQKERTIENKCLFTIMVSLFLTSKAYLSILDCVGEWFQSKSMANGERERERA